MSAFLDGRVTYELMADFWPTADEDPDAPAQVAEFARIWRDMPKVVFSRTLEGAGWNTRIVREVDPSEIRAWCEEPGGDMAVGGADLAGRSWPRIWWTSCACTSTRCWSAGATGCSRRRTSTVDFGLVQTRTFGDGVVLLHYARAAPEAR